MGKGAISILSWFGRRKRDVTLEENEENIMKVADVDKDGVLVCYFFQFLMFWLSPLAYSDFIL